MTSVMFDSLDIDDYKDGDIIYVIDSECYYIKTNNMLYYLSSCVDHSEGHKYKQIIEKCYHCGATLSLSEENIERGWTKCNYCRYICKTFEWI